MNKKVSLLMLILLLIAATMSGCFGSTSADQTTEEIQENPTEEKTNEPSEGKMDNKDQSGSGTAKVVYKDSPYLAGQDLPQVEERLPKEPKLVNENPDDWYDGGKPAIGTYGGKLRMISPDINFNPDLFIMLRNNFNTFIVF